MNSAIVWTGRILLALGLVLVFGGCFLVWRAQGDEGLGALLSLGNVEFYLAALATLTPGAICLVWAHFSAPGKSANRR
ncbi:MAG: hypothetical protein ACI8PT_002945 [Gammaproteobacteria bacterium]|jgi:hypothetical protein